MPRNDDATLHATIKQLVDEEQTLYRKGNLSDADTTRLEELKVQLDQVWDLLRQREALEEFGKDPDKAKMRPASIVEKYEQ